MQAQYSCTMNYLNVTYIVHLQIPYNDSKVFMQVHYIRNMYEKNTELIS